MAELQADDIPPLQDYQQQLKAVATHKGATNYMGDITKPNTRHLEDHKLIQQEVAKQVQKVQKTIESKAPEKSSFGFKRGFLLSGDSAKNQSKDVAPTKPAPVQIKPTKKTAPLQIPQVQDAMKMNNYLDETRSQWMTDSFLDQIGQNSKVAKLFSNPQYMKAIDLFKTNPRQAMLKYGNNKQFMDGFQQFCKLMGNQLVNLKK